MTQINKTRETKQIGGGPKGLMKFKTNTKSRVRKTSVGMVGKRKATPVPETYVAGISIQYSFPMCFNQRHLIVLAYLMYRPRKRIASQRQPTTEPLDMDEATSRPGGFADDEDGRSIKADRKEVIGQKKISRRTATVRTSPVLFLAQQH